MVQSSNPVGWFEIPVRDMKRAVSFYERVFGHSFSVREFGPLQMAMFSVNNPGAAGAGGALVKHEAYQPSLTGAVIYFRVGDIDATLARVTANGGKVIHPKRNIGQFGHVAHVEDSEGNRVAMHERATQPPKPIGQA
jgi:predicted enzyme related to lactoylglutathione lyase